MKHYLKKLEETVREQWTRKALCDYNGDSFTYAQLATNIERFRIFFDAAGIGKGDKIAICARNSARWAMTFWGINVNECVAVPLLADFHPSNVITLTNHSDSVLLFVDDDIWSKLNPEEMPVLKAAINVKDGNLLWHRDEKTAEAWEKRKSAFAQRYPDGMWPEQVSYPDDNMDELAIINYTSGTTGNPKGVMLTYGAMSDTDDFANSHFPNHPGETVVSMLHAAHDQQANVSERMRLFYVALTRAEENAILIQSKGKLNEEGNPIIPVRDTIASSKDFSDFMLFVKSPLKEKELAVEPFVQLVSAKSQQERTLSFQSIQNYAKTVPLPKRPSKEIKGKIDEGALVFGTHLHRLLELTDLKTRDVSWIKDAKERALLERVLSLPLLSDSANASIYKEYQFEDEQGQTGIIDLLLVYPDHALIVDYKTSNIDDFSYDKQVKAYASYVTKAFRRPVKTYLLSILKAEVREIS